MNNINNSKKLYTRNLDPLASTKFTYSRFLVPAFMNYKGWAIFCDCVFLFFQDISMLCESIDEDKALYCVQHDYTPKERHKMDGKKQTIYPRKNWSSFMIFNCSHPSNRKLTIDIVNSFLKNSGYLIIRFLKSSQNSKTFFDNISKKFEVLQEVNIESFFKNNSLLILKLRN